MSLKVYNRKRDFDRSPEPRGDSRASGERLYVVQKHDASRLHYDFRLQIGGALVSWAVPKGPSLDPAQKRLAVHVEDHPLEYGAFEAVIPKGQYGGGTVMLWDRGEWEPNTPDPEKAIKGGKLSFTLRGERLRGGWTLTRMRSKAGDEKDNWLLIKADDEFAHRGDGDAAIVREVASVATGRDMDEIAAGGTPSRARKPTASGTEELGDLTQESISGTPGVVLRRIPRAIKPQLCKLVDTAPRGKEWIHEMKFDGYRIVAMKSSSGVRLLTRSGKDWTRKFSALAERIESLPLSRLIIDGELTILSESGVTSFQRLQNAIKDRSFNNLVYYAFDLIYAEGYDLTQVSLITRKELLHRLVPSMDEGLVRYSDHVDGGGEAVYDHACELGLEGIISKRKDAAYQQRRSTDWLKLKCTKGQEFVILGWTPPAGSRKHFGSLLLGVHDRDGALVYVGKVGSGFTSESLGGIKDKLDRLARKTCPADKPASPAERRGARWVTPELVAEVEFSQWTDDGRLRHPVFKGLRADKPAEQVVCEKPLARKDGAVSKTARSNNPRSQRKRTEADSEAVEGVRISNRDRIIAPDIGATKGELAEYYASIAPSIMPFVSGRPLSTVRCPRGRAEKCFFQKHRGDTMREPVGSMEVMEKSGPADYISIDSSPGLVTLVQFGVIELHPWACVQGEPEVPDVLTFDLDPGEGAPFDLVKEGARLVRKRLAERGLTGFLKATGGKGLHVVAPLRRGSSWEEVKAFSKDLARSVAREFPDRYVAVSTKEKRRGKVFIDYLRNGRGSTAVAPFSARARSGLPVAVPLRWDELSRLESASHYNIRTVPMRIARLKSEPWGDFENTRAALPSGPGS